MIVQIRLHTMGVSILHVISCLQYQYFKKYSELYKVTYLTLSYFEFNTLAFELINYLYDNCFDMIKKLKMLLPMMSILLSFHTIKNG